MARGGNWPVHGRHVGHLKRPRHIARRGQNGQDLRELPRSANEVDNRLDATHAPRGILCLPQRLDIAAPPARIRQRGVRGGKGLERADCLAAQVRVHLEMWLVRTHELGESKVRVPQFVRSHVGRNLEEREMVNVRVQRRQDSLDGSDGVIGRRIGPGGSLSRSSPTPTVLTD